MIRMGPLSGLGLALSVVISSTCLTPFLPAEDLVFLHLGAGIPLNGTYQDFINEEMTWAEDNYGDLHLSGNVFELGLYFNDSNLDYTPNNNFFWGLLFASTFTGHYKDGKKDIIDVRARFDWFSAPGSACGGIGVMQFFGEDIGEGFYLRGGVTTGAYYEVTNRITGNRETFQGMGGGVIGAGYSIRPKEGALGLMFEVTERISGEFTSLAAGVCIQMSLGNGGRS
jgi:hypothetical protein